jgi:uroporphyrinogen III methyltransferase/synthase
MNKNEKKKGKVYLVGAGPGDPGLITVRGREILSIADVVVYDRLAHPSLLNICRPDAEKIYVGKSSNQHTMQQKDINALLIKSAKAGKCVCRLKGGDPFVFGRGAEEAEACYDSGISCDIIPGITSAIAGPAYAGIPVTHRDIASSFAVITGHEEPGRNNSRIQWENLTNGTDTLIFLMGFENLSAIVSRLMEAGKSPETPAALVCWATWAQQQTLVSNLQNIQTDSEKANFTPPCVLVVGKVINMREKLKWFEKKPLFGKKILVTRAREQASSLSLLLREYGADPVEFPAIRIEPLSDLSRLDNALHHLPHAIFPHELAHSYSGDCSEYHWIVFTSANAVRIVWNRIKALNYDARIFARVKIAAIGSATGEALGEIGITADFIPSRFVAETIIDEWPEKDMAGKGVMIPRAQEARELLPEELMKMGAHVSVIPVYQTVSDVHDTERILKDIQDGDIHIITFTSSSTVKNFIKGLAISNPNDFLKKCAVACIGPITAKTAKEYGLKVDVVSEEYSIEGLTKALIQYYNK